MNFEVVGGETRKDLSKNFNFALFRYQIDFWVFFVPELKTVPQWFDEPK